MISATASWNPSADSDSVMYSGQVSQPVQEPAKVAHGDRVAESLEQRLVIRRIADE